MMIVYRLFSLSFFGISVMLAISSIVTTYATMYRSTELPFLMTSPLTMAEIVVYKFLESCLFSSWAFFFIIVPFVGSFAWHEHLSPLFVLWTFLFSVPFVVLCSALGTVITMCFVRWVPGGRLLKGLGILIGIATLAGIWWIAHGARQAEDPGGLVLTRLIPGLQLASYPLLPSWWVSEGIISFARAQWFRGAMLWITLVSNTLVVCFAVEAIGAAVFYSGWQRVVSSSSYTHRRKPLLGWLDKALSPLPHDVRGLVVKDIRTFLRDPLQWSQFLIFLGLLGLYFANMRSFRYNELPDQWRSLIAFLNIFSMSTVLCSLSSRFIYPQLSLEGHGFWILGLAPTTMWRIMATKFGLSLLGLSSVSVSLMYLSTEMLGIDPDIKRVAICLAACMSVAIAAMSTGLGAIFLDLRQRNPAAIVSGFGGTLNLVLSLFFMLSTILPFGAVFQLRLMGRIGVREAAFAVNMLYIWLAVATLLATFLPLIAGRKSLLAREY